MIVTLNGWPGVGKLTVAVELATLLQGRFLDNHSVINVAKLLTDYGTDDYYDTIRSVRDVAFKAIKNLPPTLPVIMTTALAASGPRAFAEEYWASVRTLARERGSKLFLVTLNCERKVHFERIQSPSRRDLHKMSEPDMVKNAMSRQLITDGADYRCSIDNTALEPKDCAQAIFDWIRRF